MRTLPVPMAISWLLSWLLLETSPRRSPSHFRPNTLDSGQPHYSLVHPLTILSHTSKAHSFPQRSQHMQQAHHPMEWPESHTPGVHHGVMVHPTWVLCLPMHSYAFLYSWYEAAHMEAKIFLTCFTLKGFGLLPWPSLPSRSSRAKVYPHLGDRVSWQRCPKTCCHNGARRNRA